MSLQVARDAEFVELSCKYPWFTPPASIPPIAGANDSSFSQPDARHASAGAIQVQSRTAVASVRAPEGFDGLAAWRDFCRDSAARKAPSLWQQSVRQLKRVFPRTFACLLGLTGCGCGGGSSGPVIGVASDTNPPAAMVTGATAKITATAI